MQSGLGTSAVLSPKEFFNVDTFFFGSEKGESHPMGA